MAIPEEQNRYSEEDQKYTISERDSSVKNASFP
jgi:hypothetical protein